MAKTGNKKYQESVLPVRYGRAGGAAGVADFTGQLSGAARGEETGLYKHYRKSNDWLLWQGRGKRPYQ